MPKTSQKERERDYRIDQEGYYLRLKQVFSSSDFISAWADAEEKWGKVQESTEQFLRAQEEIDRRDQLKVTVQTPQGSRQITKPFPVRKSERGGYVETQIQTPWRAICKTD
jgi:hypothetical protein